MTDYSLMYTKLFQTCTRIIELLQEVQHETERMYMEQQEINAGQTSLFNNHHDLT